MSNENQATANIDDLLDSNIDDLADLPEFLVFPNGVHRVTISWEKKEVNKHPCVELKMKAIETVELANSTDTPLVAGAETSVLYMMDNEFGQGAFKDVMKVLAPACGTTKVSETLEASKGMEVQVVTVAKQDKKDKDIWRTNVKKVIVG